MIDVVSLIRGNEKIGVPRSLGKGQFRAVTATICRSINRMRSQPGGRRRLDCASSPSE